MLLLLRSLRVEIENRLNALGGKFRAESGSFLAAQPAVFATHLVRNSVAVRLGQSHALLCENGLEGLPILRPGIAKSLSHAVAELLLKTARLEPLARLIPVGLRLHRRRQNLATLFPHEAVVFLMQALLPRPEPAQRFSGQAVVVLDDDVVVQMLPIVVRDDQIVRGM